MKKKKSPEQQSGPIYHTWKSYSSFRFRDWNCYDKFKEIEVNKEKLVKYIKKTQKKKMNVLRNKINEKKIKIETLNQKIMKMQDTKRLRR